MLEPPLKALGPGYASGHNQSYMTPDNNYPRICLEEGLTCETCTAGTARQLASVCKGLRGKMIGQLFVQIHPHPACARMHAHFADCYREALSAETPGAIVIAAVA